jgi:sulfite exporter TauE/SafE
MTYLWIFVAGAAASFHCVGMCGGFALAVGTQRSRPLLRQLLYNVGRLNALVLIGALSGGAGAAFLTAVPIRLAENLLALIAGVAMLAVALEMLGIGRRITTHTTRLARATIGQALSGVMRSESLAAPLAFGVFNAFLPCQLIYAFAARAASTASLAEGMLTMLAFGLGTVPALAAVGLSGSYFSHSRRRRLVFASAVLVIGYGLITLGRGFGFEWHPGGHAGHVH